MFGKCGHPLSNAHQGLAHGHDEQDWHMVLCTLEYTSTQSSATTTQTNRCMHITKQLIIPPLALASLKKSWASHAHVLVVDDGIHCIRVGCLHRMGVIGQNSGMARAKLPIN